MGLISKSKSHISSVEESYWQHLCFASKYSCCCLKAGLMGLVHGLVPALFETSASDMVNKLHGKVHKDCRDLSDM